MKINDEIPYGFAIRRRAGEDERPEEGARRVEEKRTDNRRQSFSAYKKGRSCLLIYILLLFFFSFVPSPMDCFYRQVPREFFVVPPELSAALVVMRYKEKL